MIRYIWVGFLSISFCCSHIFAQKPPDIFYIGVEGNKKSFLFKEEISIQNYSDVLGVLKQEYGEDSGGYISLFPDTAKFRTIYGFPFFYIEKGARYKAVDSIMKLCKIMPMVGISYEQAKVYCQWMTTFLNDERLKNKYIWQCSLPEKADYEMAFNSSKAKITQKKPLSFLQNKYRCIKGINYTVCRHKRGNNYIYGLTDNVAEYMQDGMVVEGGENTVLKFIEAKDSENPIGFRVKLTVVSKK
jgi:hypothetical protein